ncbi:MAG: AMP-binding protein [Mycobacteriaceae bacterium]|nr:AMP-binding protein [Mycobacteriaceae bacterium]
MTREWTLGAVLDAIACAVPDRLMTVCGDRKSTFGESSVRTGRLANFLVASGFGTRRPRSALHRWECGQDRVALVMYNDLYADAMIGCLKARAVPVNVNHNYSAREIHDILEYVGPRGIIYHKSLGPLVADAAPPDATEPLMSVDDGSDIAELPGAIPFDDALALGAEDRRVEASPDDVLMVCTGGTTGRPKGVLWRQGDVYVSSMGGADHESAQALAGSLCDAGQRWFAVSPLMHAAGIWTTFAAVLNGRTVLIYDNRRKFDARDVLETAEREKVTMFTIVGDAYAGPLVAELERRHYDLTSLIAIGTGGAATNLKYKQAFLQHLPHATIVEGYGSSETGGMAYGASRRGSTVETFAPHPGGVVVSADRTRILRPGEDEIGWAARAGRIPLGYFNDRDATERTFPEVDGRRVVVPGDRAKLESDGSIRLFGRDSLVVNTGGEKVFVEEVEEVLRAHPGIADALVVGRPSERWGEEVVALVSVKPDVRIGDDALYGFCTSRLARFKAPKAFLFVDEVRRLGNGKPDYRWAKQQADSKVPTGELL